LDPPVTVPIAACGTPPPTLSFQAANTSPLPDPSLPQNVVVTVCPVDATEVAEPKLILVPDIFPTIPLTRLVAPSL